MTTRARSSTLPAYKFLLPSETAGVGYVVSPAGDYTANSTWSLVPSGVAPYNAAAVGASAPVDSTIKGQNASGSFAAVGGNVTLTPGTGSVGNVSGNVKIQDTGGNGGAWNTAHLMLGIYHFWVDSSGRLRIKNSAPISDTDGTVVGTQS